MREILLRAGESLTLADGTVIRSVAGTPARPSSDLPPEVIDWPALIADFKSMGWVQQAIADAVDCSQSAISQLNQGVLTDISYRLGIRLLALHARVMNEGRPGGPTA